MMPKEFTFEFYELHFLPVQFTDNLWSPMFLKAGEFLYQRYFFHSHQYATFVFWRAGFITDRYFPDAEIANVINPQTAVIRIIARMKMPSANRSIRCMRRMPRVRSAQ